jgi:uncharacterized protein (TIGR01319 family)
MEAVLLIDFGSTNTKVTAVDPENRRLLGTAAGFTTVETDIGEGLAEALSLLQKETGTLSFIKRFACSSAAGGLRMVASGLVPALTAEAARLAALGAGAKIVGLYSYELTDEDVLEIAALKPDIFLLTGGVDGGNRECILHNAKILSSMNPSGGFPILIAGNRSAAAECERLLSGWQVIRCPNVLPALGKLNIEAAQEQIRRLFLERIIHARGLSRERELISGILMPTPSAVKRALELLSEGTDSEKGLGELVAVDLGGATTDVYSVASGVSQTGEVILKGIPEPYSKRTVEGDIGMRYSAGGVLEAAGVLRLSGLSGLDPSVIEQRVPYLAAHPEAIPATPEDERLDYALAAGAVETAVERHAGSLEEVFTPTGPVFVQTGKDLRGVRRLILTGGAVIHNSRAQEIAGHAGYRPETPGSLRPVPEELYIDRSYILAAMGLLAETLPHAALSIMKKEIQSYGT